MNIKLQSKVQLILLVVAGLLTTQVTAETDTIDKTFDVSGGGTLNLVSDKGSIEVETWDKAQVHVVVRKTARNKDRLEQFEVSIEQSGADIMIDGDGNRSNRVKVQYRITVPRDYNVKLNTGGGSIEVADINGEVDVDTSGGSIRIGNVTGGDVKAETSGGSIRVGDVDGDLDVNTSGGSIKLGSISGNAIIDTSGGSISVDSGGKDVKADTSGGSIKIGPSKGNVNVDTSGGSIRIAPADGDVTANTSGGSIKIERSGGAVNADTSGGGIFVGGSMGPVIAETGGGSITIKDAKGYIEADTAGGSIEAHMTLDDNSADTHVDLETSGGSITVYLPRNLEATVDARLRLTSSARKDYRIYSDFPLSIRGEQSNRISANGDLNGGGDLIRLETTNGDIHIKMID